MQQKRLTVMALELTGSPAPSATWRRDVQALLALGHRAAEDQVLDLGRIEPRRALQRGL